VTYKIDPNAPRFSAYIASPKRQDMLVVPRESWEAMGDTGSVGIVDVSHTPLAGLAWDSCFVAAEAVRHSADSGHVDLVRIDEKDPKPYNRDRYLVMENLDKHPQFPDWVKASDTKASPELAQYMSNHVFLQKQDPNGAGWHWQNESDLSLGMREVARKKTKGQQG